MIKVKVLVSCLIYSSLLFIRHCKASPSLAWPVHSEVLLTSLVSIQRCQTATGHSYKTIEHHCLIAKYQFIYH